MKAGETMNTAYGRLVTAVELLQYELLVEQRRTNELLQELIKQGKPAPAPAPAVEASTTKHPKTLTTTTTKAGVK